jgi:glucan endo-1,3-alpha-glucosidase
VALYTVCIFTFHSFDMSYSWASSDMVNIFNAHASSSAMYKWNSHPLVSTFSGKANGNSFYAGFKSSLASLGHNISFAPAFIDYRDPTQAKQVLSDFPSVDGFFNWWSWCVKSVLITPMVWD